LAVWGPTGAPGRSVIALGLASELAALGAPTTIVDCDVYGGSIAQLLGLLDEASGLLAAARSANNGQLTAELLSRQSRAVTPSMRVLTGLPRADRWVEIRPRGIRDILSVTRELSAFSVVDCGFNLELDEEISYDTAAPRRNGATVAALEAADTVIVVGAADPVGLSRLVRALGELRDVVPHCSPVVVVNRMRAGLGWSREDIVATLARVIGSSPLVFMPDDQAAVDAAVVHGRTLGEAAPNSKLTRTLRSLAGDLAGLGSPSPSRNGQRLARRRRR
jgi:MinD-like ATPase involved in chromosome partitioning or flagellar assembly